MTTNDLREEDEDKEGAGDEGDLLFRRLKRWYREASQSQDAWKTEAKEDYAFYASDQWTPEDKAKLKEQLRPEVTFNRVGPIIDSVSGMEVGNRQEVTYLPREVGPKDGGVSEMLTNAAKFFRDESEAEDEESDAFQDAIICGIGCTETRPDFEQDSDGLIPTDRIDPLCTFWDPNAKKRNLTDRRFCGYVKEMDIADARALAESLGVKVEDEDLHATWAVSGSEPEEHDATPQNAYNKDRDDQKPQRQAVSIVFFEWYERETYYIAHDPFTNKKTELETKQFVELKKRLTPWGVQFKEGPTPGEKQPQQDQPQPNVISYAKLPRKVHKQAFVGGKVLDTGEGRCPDEFTLNFITGKRDRNKNSWFGLVRGMKDPQRWANKFFSTILHRISTTGKGVVMEKTAVSNVREFEDRWSSADAVKWVNDGGLGKFQQLEGVAIVPAESNMLEFAISSIRDVTGVNLELLGMADREQAGVLEAQRKQAGMTILATLFDSLRRYRKQQGRALLYIIQNYIPAGRLIRIDEQNGPQYVQLVKSPGTTKYDVIVDEASTSPNRKEAVWAMIIQMMPILSRMPPAVMGKMLEYSPLPVKLGEEISQALAAPPPPDPKLQVLQQKAQMDGQAKQQDMQIAQQTAQMTMMADQQAAQLDAQIKRQELEFERQKFILETLQDQQRHQQQMRQDEMMGQFKLEQSAQQSDARIEQMKKQAAARPKVATKH